MKIIIKILTILFLDIFLIIRLFHGEYGLLSSLIWIISIFILSKTVHPPQRNLHSKLHLPPLLFFVLVFVFLAKIIFIILSPTSIPFHGDEAINSRNAQSNFEAGILHRQWNLLASDWGTLNQMPALWYTLQGGIIYLLSPSLLSVKIFAIISDLFLCCLLYFLVSRLLNRRLAIFTTILYLSFPVAIHFSMTGYQNIQSTVMLFWSVYLLSLIPFQYHRRAFIYYCLRAGIISGLSLYFYLSSSINPLICLCIIFCFIFWEHHENFIFKLKHFFVSTGCFLAGVIVSAIPYLFYSIYQYNFVTGRSSEIIFSQFKSNFFDTLISQSENFFQSFLPWGIFNGSGAHYINSSFLPGIGIFLCFLIGLLISFKKFKKREFFIPLIIFLITSISGGLLTKDTPAPQRLIHLFPVVIIFVILSINLVKNYWIQGIIIVYLLIVNIYSYFTKNIPVYRQNLPNDAYEISTTFYNNPSKLIFSAPIHKKNQIYYYSRGKVDPQLSLCQSTNFTPSKYPNYFFVDDVSLPLLTDCHSQTYSIVKEWTSAYDHTMLLKFN